MALRVSSGSESSISLAVQRNHNGGHHVITIRPGLRLVNAADEPLQLCLTGVMRSRALLRSAACLELLQRHDMAATYCYARNRSSLRTRTSYSRWHEGHRASTVEGKLRSRLLGFMAEAAMNLCLL